MEQQIWDFLERLQQGKDYSRNTVEAYRNDLNQFMLFAQNERPALAGWGRVDKPMILAFIIHLKDRGYTPSSVARKIAVLKSFYHSMLEHRVIDTDPTATVGSPKVEKRSPQVLSSDEIEWLLAAPAKHSTPKGFRDRAILELLAASGMRVSELTALNVEHVNAQDRTVHCLGRGGKRRVIPISEGATIVLTDYLQRGRPAWVRKEENALFVNPHGERLTRQGMWLVIKEYVKEANIKSPVTPHTLRHSFAVHLLNHGEDMANVQRLLGHANIATTQMYARMIHPLPLEPIESISKKPIED